jgi:hypothetical protein
VNSSFLSQARVSISDALDGAAHLPMKALFLFSVELRTFFFCFPFDLYIWVWEWQYTDRR